MAVAAAPAACTPTETVAAKYRRPSAGDAPFPLHLRPVFGEDHPMESAGVPSSGGRLLLAGTVGALVALSLGIYGNVHDPATDLSITLGFKDTITMKVWLASLAVLFAVVQVGSALWMYGKLPLGAGPAWLGSLHRISGRLAFLLSLPVAYHCLYQLAFQDTSTRVLIHSLLGCAFYGAFAAKVVVVRSHSLPGIALPLAGGALFTLLVGVWLTSAWWFISNNGLPSPVVVLARIDRILAPLTWLAAAFVVLVLFVGPALIGAKKEGGAAASAPAGAAAAPSGKEVFSSAGCGGCHTLAAAGSSGTTGPNLDDAKPSADTVEGIVTSGAGIMPSFKGRLSAAEIKAVAQFVSGTRADRQGDRPARGDFRPPALGCSHDPGRPRPGRHHGRRL